MTDDPPCARPWPTPAAAGPCSPACPDRRSPPPRTATATPPPTSSRSPAGSAATPDWNLAIATGAPGPDVLDVDDHGPAGNGYAAFGRLHCAGLLDGAAGYVRTPSGGLHAYFTGPHQRNGHLAAHHLDFRSAGGYVLAPPSQVDGHPYLPSGRPGGRRHPGLGRRQPRSCNPSRSRTGPAASPAAEPGPGQPGPLGRPPARRQPQRRPVLGRQPRPRDRPRRRPEPARRRRPPGRPRRRRKSPGPWTPPAAPARPARTARPPGRGGELR